ncbi:MAG: ribonuclease HII [Pseudomonadota bacterium]
MGLDFAIEKALHARGYCHVAGVDEVGRGPLAGPVTAAAVILNPKDIPAAVNDSKKLSKKTREQVYEALLQTAKISVAHATVAEIDSLNILRASHLAMNRALDGLSTSADYALIDGNMLPRRLALPGAAFVKGDARVASIAAASIVAKVCRDRVMLSLAQQHPGYGWETNAGYGTPAHLCALRNLGITPHHRRSFKPVYNML